MTRAAASPRASLDALLPDLGKGLRAAVVTLVPFYLATRLERPDLAWTALGGWLGTLADPGGVRRTRARALAAFGALGFVLVPLGELAGTRGPLTVAALAVVAFVASLFRVFGAVASSIGTLCVIVTCIATARAAEATAPLRDGAAFAVGTWLVASLSTVVWPAWPHRPVRAAMRATFESLAAYADALEVLVVDGRPPGDGRYALVAREHPRKVREAIEAARDVAAAVRARRPGESRVGANLRVLLGLAESELLLLVTVANELEPVDPAARPPGAPEALAALARDARTVATRLGARAIAHAPERASVAPPSLRDTSPWGVLVARLASLREESLALSASLDAATRPEGHTLAGAGALDGEAARPPSVRGALLRDLRALRDALSFRSTHLRHAARVTAAAMTAATLGRFASTHPHWVTLTTLAVLQPYPSATFTRAVERVVGTVAGSVVAAGLLLGVKRPELLGLALVPLSVAAVATRPRSYRLFTFFLTPVFVLLADHRGGDVGVALARSRDACLGGAVALVFALLAFPSWERRRLPDVLGAMLDAVATYAATVLGALGAGASPEVRARVVVPARRSCAAALAAAEASLERLLAEPFALRRSATTAGEAVTVLTYGRRLAGAVTALDVSADVGLADPLPPAVTAEVADYVRVVAVNARRRARERARVAEREEPLLPEDLAPRARAALGRVVRYAALLDAIGGGADVTPPR